MIDKKRIEQIAEQAQDAFWAKVAELVPEARSGDFDPLASHRFDMMCEGAVKHWMECNVPWQGPEE